MAFRFSVCADYGAGYGEGQEDVLRGGDVGVGVDVAGDGGFGRIEGGDGGGRCDLTGGIEVGLRQFKGGGVARSSGSLLMLRRTECFR